MIVCFLSSIVKGNYGAAASLVGGGLGGFGGGLLQSIGNAFQNTDPGTNPFSDSTGYGGGDLGGGAYDNFVRDDQAKKSASSKGFLVVSAIAGALLLLYILRRK